MPIKLHRKIEGTVKTLAIKEEVIMRFSSPPPMRSNAQKWRTQTQ
ncbi:MAG: hypothetical protein QXK57_06890 [Conexivisphaerales archaeon]